MTDNPPRSARSLAQQSAQSNFHDMLDGHDWMVSPQDCALTGEEIREMAELFARSFARSRAVLDMTNGPGSYTNRMELALARVWAAGFKSGSAVATYLATQDKENEHE